MFIWFPLELWSAFNHIHMLTCAVEILNIIIMMMMIIIIINNKTLRAMIACWRLKVVIIAAIWLADIRFINLSWHLIGW